MSACAGCGGGGEGVNLGAVLERIQQSRKQEKKWSDKIKEMMKEIADAKPKDRLAYALEFTKLFYALTFSMGGWGQWLGFGIQMKGVPYLGSYAGFAKLNLAECEAIYLQLKVLVLEFLKIDYELSMAKEKQNEELIEAKKKTRKRKKKKTEKNKTTYIH